MIEIDIDRQLVLAVDDGHVTRIFNASSGNGERYEAKGRTYVARTGRGTFQVGRQINGNHESTLELGSMWRPKFFNGGIALHGSGSVPPPRVARVRACREQCDELDLGRLGCPAGTTVIVY
ncbi:L,D-transpeptidase [Oerskovia sp. M15]